jgi:hypothetical protein
MATPIQYIPQPIFNNVGVLQQQLAQDQQRYAQAMANQLAMEDAFAQLQTHVADIPLKNEILSEFQQKVKETVDRYGGDYGAASRDLARLVSQTRQNPFFQLAPERRRLAEEQRKLMLQLGPNAILAKDVTSVPLRDPETGEWISPEDLNYSVLDQRQYEEFLNRRYGVLRNRTTPGEWTRNSQYPWMLERSVYKGILPEEVEDYKAQMSADLAAQHPELPEEYREMIADSYANQLMMGSASERITDPLYAARAKSGSSGSSNIGYITRTMPGEVYPETKEEINKKWADTARTVSFYQDLRQSTGTDNISDAYRTKLKSLGIELSTDKLREKDKRALNSLLLSGIYGDKNSEKYKLAQELMKLYYTIDPDGGVAKREDGTYGRYVDIYSTGLIDTGNFDPKIIKTIYKVLNSNEQLEKLLRINENPIFNNLVGPKEEGKLSPDEASLVMADFEGNKYITNNRTWEIPAGSTNEITNSIVRNIQGSFNKQDKYQYLDEDNKLKKGKGNLSALLSDSDTKVTNAQILPPKGQIIINAIVDGDPRKILVDSTQFSEQTKEWLDTAKILSDAYYDTESLGDLITFDNYIVDSKGNRMAVIVTKQFIPSDPNQPFVDENGNALPGKIVPVVYQTIVDRNGKEVGDRVPTSIEAINKLILDQITTSLLYSVDPKSQTLDFNN